MINGRGLAAFLLDWRVGDAHIDDDGDTDSDDLDFFRVAFRQR
jgi:hypothetical protein